MKVIRSIKKAAAVATGALFLGATLGAAAVFGSGLSTLSSASTNPLLHNNAVSSVVVVGSNAAAQDILGSIDIAAALTAQAASLSTTASGSVVIGTYSLSSTAKASTYSSANGTAFVNNWSPLSATVLKENWSAVPGNLKSSNYTAIENVTFSATAKPELNGLNVEFPVGSFKFVSYDINLSNSKAVVNTTHTSTVPLKYLVGSSFLTVLNRTSVNYTTGSSSVTDNVKVPGSLTIGSDTVNLLGVETVLPGSGSYSQLEFNVNGGATQYVNLSVSTTVSGVTLKATGPLRSNATNVYYLPSITLSAISKVQNWSSANVFGLGNYNTSTKDWDYFNFSLSKAAMLDASLSTAANLALPVSAISLEALTHSYVGAKNAQNITVTAGNPGVDRFLPLSGLVASKNVNFNLSHGLPNVAVGADFRGPLATAAEAYANYSGPDFSLEPYQWYFNTTGNRLNITAPSENIFPLTKNHSYVLNTTVIGASADYSYVVNNSKNVPVALLVQLPNGKSFALQFKELAGTGTYAANDTMNATTLYNGSYSSQQTIKENMTYSFGGYNLTTKLKEVNINTTAKPVYRNVTEFNLSGPVASLSTGGSFVPGYAGLYQSNGTVLSSYTLPNQLGALSFSGTVLTYTEPTLGGKTTSVTVTENKSDYTYLVSPTNGSADSWGAYVTAATKDGATFVIPSQNYTLALNGTQTITGKQTVSLGGSVSSGKLLNITGVSSVSASGLFGSGVFPLAELDTSFSSSTNSVPVVIVGGPAANKLAQTVLGLSGPVFGSQFTNLTGVGSGQALVEWFTNVSGLGHQNALLVAGYNAGDTLNAAEVVAEALLGTPVSGVALNGTKMILSTSSSSYTGVTVVSSS